MIENRLEANAKKAKEEVSKALTLLEVGIDATNDEIKRAFLRKTSEHRIAFEKRAGELKEAIPLENKIYWAYGELWKIANLQEVDGGAETIEENKSQELRKELAEVLNSPLPFRLQVMGVSRDGVVWYR